MPEKRYIVWVFGSAGSHEVAADMTDAIAAYAHAVYEVAEHFVIGWGPTLGTTLQTSFERGGDSEDAGDARAFGAQAMVAGWF